MHGTNRRSAEVSVDLANGNADTQGQTEDGMMGQTYRHAVVTTHIFDTKGRYLCGARPDRTNEGALFARNADCRTCLHHGD